MVARHRSRARVSRKRNPNPFAANEKESGRGSVRRHYTIIMLGIDRSHGSVGYVLSRARRSYAAWAPARDFSRSLTFLYLTPFNLTE